jgi:hypothetical protein
MPGRTSEAVPVESRAELKDQPDEKGGCGMTVTESESGKVDEEPEYRPWVSPSLPSIAPSYEPAWVKEKAELFKKMDKAKRAGSVAVRNSGQ